ncbi:MAG TPA: hypothetical protein VFV98_06030 [Vicinamibacterales bacterium]|nr:hypothetical protein [Vicinamibacterales bacterium]
MHVRRALVALVIACCFSVTACGDDPPATAPTKFPTRIELTGPSTIAPGSVAQFTLTAFYADGTSADVTGNASWCCDQPTLQLQAAGRFVGRASGDAFVNARYTNNMSRSRQVVVVPEGTFRVTGRVFEPGTTSPISLAHISVNDGAGGSLSTDADFSGSFALYGVPRSADFVISHAGYETQSRHMEFSDHAAITLELPLAGPRLDFAGTFTATFDWRACSSRVLPEYSRRVYTAVVTQAGSVLDVRFTEPAFAVNSVSRGNLMQGQINAAGVTLYAEGLSYYYYGPTSYPSLVERLPDDGRLVVSGTSTLTPSGVSFVGEIKGSMEIYGRGFPNGAPIGNCRDAALSFTDRR